MSVIKDILSSCSVFQGLRSQSLGQIESISEVKIFDKGERIFIKGDEATHLFIINNGAVNLSISFSVLMSEQETPFYFMQKGDLFGWSALIPPHELTMSAYAKTKCEVLSIPGLELKKLCEDEYQLGYNLMYRVATIIGSRLVKMDQILSKEIGLNTPSI